MSKQKKIKINVADIDTGEYYELYKNIKTSVNKEKFIKFYLSFIDIIDLLNKPQLTIVKYICKNIQINRATIILTHNSVNLSKSVFYKSIIGLMLHKIIYKSKHQNLYIINKTFLFNGK